MPNGGENFGSRRRPAVSRGRSVREWERDLPPGYRLSGYSDLLVLLGPGSSGVAVFSRRTTDPFEVVAVAWENYE